MAQNPGNYFTNAALVCGRPSVPKSSSVVITASHEARIGWRVDNTANYAVMPQGKKIPSFSCT